MAATFHLGVIGCGRILGAHLNGIKALWDNGWSDLRVTALCSRRDDDALRHLRRGHGPSPRRPIWGLEADPMSAPQLYLDDIDPSHTARIYTDWQAMLADPRLRLDGVLVLTPVDSHHTMAIAACELGLHVLVEKPLGLTVAATNAMLAAAERAGVVLAVAEVVRFKPLWRMARWAIEAGWLGDLQLLVELGLGGLWSPDRVRADTPWRHELLRAGGGLVVDRGVHLLHLLEYLAGPITTIAANCRCLEPTRRVFDATGRPGDSHRCEVDDTFALHATFANGAIASVSGSDALRGQRRRVPLTIYGSRGTLSEGWLSGGDRTGPLVSWYQRCAGAARFEADFPGGLLDPFALQLLAWLRACRGEAVCEIAGEVGRRDVALALAALESSLCGGAPVPVEAVLSGAVRAYQEPLDEAHGLTPRPVGDQARG